jgi:hypothetical protein
MGAEMVPKTPVSSYNQLTWLIAQEDFIELVFLHEAILKLCLYS